MSKARAAMQLLSLGPLSMAEFVEITGWRYRTCRNVLTKLVDDLGKVRRSNGLYEVSA